MAEFEPCKRCGARWEPIFKPTPEGPHYGKMVCARCDLWLRWVPKPDRDKRRREAAHTDLVRKYSPGHCEMCLILEDHVPAGETLEAHHVIEYAGGGQNARENIWIVCTACHKLIHWRRTYLSHLITDGVANETQRKQDPGISEAVSELDCLEGNLQRRQADEGSIPDQRTSGKDYRPEYLDDVR